jgi:hypothetical protein
MIRVHRGLEPAALVKVRTEKLKKLRGIVARGKGDPLSDDIDGYRVVAKALWEAQLRKCCYCEKSIEHDRNDVEHYRPKAGANRGVHHPARHGYWWLAFTWENLLFSCENCNQGKAKGIKFPLAKGGTPLVAEQPPNRYERPLLIDPAVECGVEHIQFRFIPVEKKWKPFARQGSSQGYETIRTCMLDRNDLLDLYLKHVNGEVRPEVTAVRAALAGRDCNAIDQAVRSANQKLLRRSKPFVGLSYDALQHFIPNAELTSWGLAWKPTTGAWLPVRGRSGKTVPR